MANKITRTITTGHVFVIILEDGEKLTLRLSKNNPTPEYVKKEFAKAYPDEKREIAGHMYTRSESKTYEMSVDDFIAHAEEVTDNE